MNRISFKIVFFVTSISYGNCESLFSKDSISFHKQLMDYQEKVLVGDFNGNITLLSLGKDFSQQDLHLGNQSQQYSAISYNGKFYVLYSEGKFFTIDPKDGSHSEFKIPVSNLNKFIFIDEDTIFISSPEKLIKFDLKTKEIINTIDLSYLKKSGNIQLRELYKVGDKLFIQVARSQSSGRPEQGSLAVLDLLSETIIKNIELEYEKSPSKMKPGIEPELPMTYDTIRKRLYVTVTGERPSNTGMLFRIDVENLQIDDVIDSTSFQGIVLLHPSFKKLYLLEHTSTPTTSSHLAPFLIDESGKISGVDRPTIVDTFDGLDALTMNADGTLLAMANTCITGFCIKGAGVAFVDTVSDTVITKLKSDQLGFEPTFVLFL